MINITEASIKAMVNITKAMANIKVKADIIINSNKHLH